MLYFLRPFLGKEGEKYDNLQRLQHANAASNVIFEGQAREIQEVS